MIISTIKSTHFVSASNDDQVYMSGTEETPPEYPTPIDIPDPTEIPDPVPHEDPVEIPVPQRKAPPGESPAPEIEPPRE